MSGPDAEYSAGDINTIDDDYEEGDVNTLGGAEDLEDEELGNRTEEDMATDVLVYLARSLADEPDAVVVQTETRQGQIRLRLHVAPDDMGRIIGRRGRTAQALRTLVGAAGARQGVQTSVDIVDD